MVQHDQHQSDEVTGDRELTETTVEYFGDLSVGIGSIFEADYELPDGTIRRGLTCRLVPEDDEVPRVVGEGSEVELGGARWLVLSVVDSGEAPFEYGSVTVREMRVPR